jgi:hypothetical protein
MSKLRYSSTVLEFGTRWRWVQISRHGPFVCHREKLLPGYHCMGNRVSPTVLCGKEKNSCSNRESNSSSSARSPYVYRLNYPGFSPPLVFEVSANVCGYRVPRGQHDGSLRPYSRFSRPQLLLFFQVAPQLYSRGWVDPVPDPLLLRKSGSAGNRTRAYIYKTIYYDMMDLTSI